jgi:hypothetical protein
VPVARVEEWRAWRNSPHDDDDAPPFAKPVGGAPSRVTFTDPEIA